MLKNYFIVAIRTLIRDRTITLINVISLSIGLACCLIAFLYAQNELSYDTTVPHADRIYRVVSRFQYTQTVDSIPRAPYRLASVMKSECTAAEDAIRLLPRMKQTVWYNDQSWIFDQSFFADPGFFDFFPYEFIAGDPKISLLEKGSIVLSENAAKLFFGNPADALGKELKFQLRSYRVTGVYRQKPNTSHLNPNALLSINSIPAEYETMLSRDWFYMAQAVYVKLKKNVSPNELISQLGTVHEKYIAPWRIEEKLKDSDVSFSLQKLEDIHFGFTNSNDYAESGNIFYLYVFITVGLLLLVMACINYTNLAVSRSAKRAREVGVRKTSGANNFHLVQQFIGEALLTASIAALVSLCLIEIFLPGFNHLTGKTLSLYESSVSLFLLLAMLTIAVGIISGIAPSVFLARLEPVAILRSSGSKSSALLRKSLVVFQFSVSVFMIVCTLVVFLQINFMKNRDLGFDDENVVTLRLPPDSLHMEKYPAFREKIMQGGYVTHSTTTDQVPGSMRGKILNYIEYENKTEERLINFMMAEPSLFNLLKLQMVQGTVFNEKDTSSFIVNETAVKSFGWKDPLKINIGNGLNYKGKITGVVKDFHFASLHKQIEPLIIMAASESAMMMMLKTKGDRKEVIQYLENAWKDFTVKYPFEPVFLEDSFSKLYKKDEQLLSLFIYFSILTVIIACLGLFGLTSHMIRQRTREIGIRKVLGASVINILVLINKDFFRLVLLAIVIAFPAAYTASLWWLDGFAYHIGINFLPFIAAAIAACLIAIITVSFRAITAAVENPVLALRYD